MTANRDELHHLVDELPDDQVDSVLADLRHCARPHRVPSERALAWIGAIKDGPADLSERVDDYLIATFERD